VNDFGGGMQAFAVLDRYLEIALIAIGACTVTFIAFRVVHWLWRTRNWRPTRWLGLPWGP
jgi:hypothetical protein